MAKLRGRDVAGIGRPDVGSPPPAWQHYVRVASADASAELARRAGGTVAVEPFDVLPAGRTAVLADPTGARLGVWEPRERNGAQVVNEPRAWAMSTLLSPDPEASAVFYAATFGWTTEPFDAGGSPVTLFRLPGYVGGEPEQPVSREVVAAMARAAPSSAAMWAVDFWIDDVDVAARKACDLGGRIAMGPLPTPTGKMAVIVDPQGASFSVSRVTARA